MGLLVVVVIFADEGNIGGGDLDLAAIELLVDLPILELLDVGEVVEELVVVFRVDLLEALEEIPVLDHVLDIITHFQRGLEFALLLSEMHENVLAEGASE